MDVSKDDIVRGVIKYAKEEIVNNIPDKPVKMMFAAGVKALELMPQIADKILCDPIAQVVFREKDGRYDLDDAFRIMSETMDEYGDFPVTIPIIRTPLVFKKDDIQKLREYIQGGS